MVVKFLSEVCCITGTVSPRALKRCTAIENGSRATSLSLSLIMISEE